MSSMYQSLRSWALSDRGRELLGDLRVGYGIVNVDWTCDLTELSDGTISARWSRHDKDRTKHLATSAARSANIAPNLGGDAPVYVAGRSSDAAAKAKKVTAKTLKSIADKHQSFIDLHREAASDTGLESFDLIARYTETATDIPDEFVQEGQRVTFTVEGVNPVDDPKVIGWWGTRIIGIDSDLRRCSVCAEVASLVKNLTAIKGITGANGSGASLTTINQESSQSWGRTGTAYDICHLCDVAVAASLSYLAQNDDHRIHLKEIGTTILWWSDDRHADSYGQSVFGFTADETSLNSMIEMADALRHGSRPVPGSDSTWNVAILAGAAGRISVYGYNSIEANDLIANVNRWLERTSTLNRNGEYRPYSPVSISYAVGDMEKKARDRLRQELIEQAVGMRPIKPPSSQILQLALREVQATLRSGDQIKRNTLALLRLYTDYDPTKGKDHMNEPTIGSTWGHLFGLYVQIQRRGAPRSGVGTEGQMQAALATPRTTLPRLQTKANLHLRKLRQTNGGLAFWFEQQVAETAETLASLGGLPARLTLVDKADFVLGYNASFVRTTSSTEQPGSSESPEPITEETP